MFPLDPELLLFIKFFVVITCIVFWLRLGVRWLTQGYYRRHSRHHHDIGAM